MVSSIRVQMAREAEKVEAKSFQSNPKPLPRLDFRGRGDIMGSIMPIYEFTCGDCSSDFETLVRSSDWEGEVECPGCGSEKLEKRLSVFAAGSGDGFPADDPPCSGMPSNCGRCALDN